MTDVHAWNVYIHILLFFLHNIYTLWTIEHTKQYIQENIPSLSLKVYKNKYINIQLEFANCIIHKYKCSFVDSFTIQMISSYAHFLHRTLIDMKLFLSFKLVCAFFTYILTNDNDTRFTCGTLCILYYFKFICYLYIVHVMNDVTTYCNYKYKCTILNTNVLHLCTTYGGVWYIYNWYILGFTISIYLFLLYIFNWYSTRHIF